MNHRTDEVLENSLEILRASYSNLWKSFRVLNWIGYGFLLFALIDLIVTFVPADFKNPFWEFNLVGNLVERVAAPLIGFGFVFVGDYWHRHKRERFYLSLLSWLALIVSIMYLGVALLGISSTIRIDKVNNQNLTNRLNGTTTQIQKAREEFQSVTNAEQMRIFLNKLSGQNSSPQIKGNQEFRAAKQKVSQFLNYGDQNLKANAQKLKSEQRFKLFKDSLQWNLGALLSSALFFTIWRSTSKMRRG